MKGDGIPLSPTSGPLLPRKDLFAGSRSTLGSEILRRALRVVQVATDGGLRLQRFPEFVEPDRARDSGGGQFPRAGLGPEAACDLTQAGVVAANHDVMQALVAPREQAPGGFGRGQVQFARALHLLVVELAGFGDDLGRGPGALRRAHQYQVRYEIAVHDAGCHLPRLEVAAARQHTLEVLGAGVDGPCFSMP